MVHLALLFTILKGVTWVWALITFAVSAGYQSRSDRFYNLDAAGAVTAFGVLTWIYLTASLICQYALGNHAVISVMVDTIAFGILFVIGLGSVGSLSRYNDVFDYCSVLSVCKLGTAAIALGWILVFLILGILLGEFIVTLTRYGGSLSTWKTSFNTLVQDDQRKTRMTGVETGQGYLAQNPASTTGMTNVPGHSGTTGI